jgi:hypothetical protein
MSEMIPSMAKLFERENLSYCLMLINECSPQLTPNGQAYNSRRQDRTQ